MVTLHRAEWSAVEDSQGTGPGAQVVNSVVGAERLAKFDVIIAGDDVDKKKPDPMIYNLAQQRIGLSGDKYASHFPHHSPPDRPSADAVSSLACVCLCAQVRSD
jgi:hypothetical protein